MKDHLASADALLLKAKEYKSGGVLHASHLEQALQFVVDYLRSQPPLAVRLDDVRPREPTKATIVGGREPDEPPPPAPKAEDCAMRRHEFEVNGPVLECIHCGAVRGDGEPAPKAEGGEVSDEELVQWADEAHAEAVVAKHRAALRAIYNRGRASLAAELDAFRVAINHRESENLAACAELDERTAEVKELRAELAEKDRRIADYNELILAVATVTPGETRHQSALRYIRQAEIRVYGCAQQAIPVEIRPGGKP